MGSSKILEIHVAITVDPCKPVIHYSGDMKERALYLLMEGKIEEALGVTVSIER